MRSNPNPNWRGCSLASPMLLPRRPARRYGIFAAAWGCLALALCVVQPADAVYEVGKWEVGPNCKHKYDATHPNKKTITVEFLNPELAAGTLPVVVTTVNRPMDKPHFFGVNVIGVNKGGFVAEVERLDNPHGTLDVGWCYDNVEVSWMAYTPTLA